jgi:hypothetical protein
MGIAERPYYGSSNYQGAGIYKHYKGDLYCVTGLSVLESSLDKKIAAEQSLIVGRVTVNYYPLSPGSLLPCITIMGDDGMSSAYVESWSRDLNDFNELITIDYNNFIRRFEKIA